MSIQIQSRNRSHEQNTWYMRYLHCNNIGFIFAIKMIPHQLFDSF